QTLTAEQEKAFEDHLRQIDDLDMRIKRQQTLLEKSAATAQPVEGQEPTVPAQPKGPDYPVGRLVKSLSAAQGNALLAAQWAAKTYGEGDPIVRALNTSTMASGGALVPEDVANTIIELLRPVTVIRASGAVSIPMPRGTMRMPKQTSGVTGSYGAESGDAPVQQMNTGQIVATFKKLTVLVPLSNDWLRYATPATDQLVQNDVVQGLARTEDLAFLRGDGTADWPRGLRAIVPAGNLITSTAVYTLDTVDNELTAAILALETANVPMLNPCWFFHPRVKQYLMTLKNSNGFYVYKDEMTQQRTLRGYPFRTTTQIPQFLGAGGNETEILFADMAQALIFDALALAVGLSQDGTYKDASGQIVSAFQRDETLIRAIAEHDFHLRHDQAVAVITNVKWG
ncbi:MAG: phage major capsid protein, partial [Rhodospirillales bacterium]|nr:phage major capsid protein [Rhodospirillales bacterium]